MFKALSIQQPWVELILLGRKTIEVRSWSTVHRGSLWLHAGKKVVPEVLNRFQMSSSDLHFGALVGRCDLVDCVEFSSETWSSLRNQHLNEGPLSKPRYAWFLRDATRIAPIPFKGRLGLMKIDSLPTGQI